MPGTTLPRTLISVLLTVTAACGYDSTDPSRYDPPPPEPALYEGLWNASGSAAAFHRLALTQLLSGGKPSPVATVTTASASLGALNAMAFDTDGSLWIASQDASLLFAFSPERLAASGLQVANKVIVPTGGSLSRPLGIAFDRQHRMWVVNSASGTMVRFDPAQLVTGGTPVPAVTIAGLGHPSALAFDASGAVWVSDIATSTLMKFAAAQLEASGAPAAEVVLRATRSSLVEPAGLAFDAAGNLWVANVGNATVVAFGPAELAVTGAPPARITLASNVESLPEPTGLAFEGDGSLWVMNFDGTLVRFARGQLGASGEPEPTVRLVLNELTEFWNVAFWPKPNGLPLN